ncbi:MAG: glucokinase [Nitrospiraceae bacterium]|nr:MAG: glucokinase [Nitrospiraceae bacterium]
MKNILTADIGGTNSRFAHFATDDNGNLLLVSTIWLQTGEVSSFKELISNLNVNEFSILPDGADIAVIAIAGPVERGVYSAPPFISWDIDISHAGTDYGFNKCVLINDFVAQAFASKSPVGDSAETILRGAVVNDAATAVIGAGTALGKAVLMPDGRGGYIAVPSEGGHASFPFSSEREFQYHDFLMKQLDQKYITANFVVSGRGLRYLHHFLSGRDLKPEEVSAELSDESETLEWASRFYGRVCRNYALETLSLGGVYIAGGVAAKIPQLIKHRAFEDEFRSSSTMSDILGSIPVFLINNEESGLWGAAFLGLQTLNSS